ncbi:MAG TPA: NADP-dependent oxidoreductase [Thermoleophilaceae bacterium]
MHVAEVSEFGGPEVLRLAERPDPEPGPGEVVVAIHAVGVNPTDISTRDGSRRKRMPDLEPPFVPGWDLAGELAETGERVVGMIPFVQIGGRVGAYAERAAVDPAWLAPLPDGVPFEEAATLPLNSLTARQSLDLLGLGEGDTLLVTGASGGVGGFAVQMAVADGLRVIGMAGRGDEDWVAALGAHEVLPRDADLDAVGPVDGVLDAVPVGPERSTGALRDGGTAVFTRSPGDAEPERGQRFETILVRPDAAALTRFAEELAGGRLRTRVARVLPLGEAAEAHRLAEAGGLRGKVVLATRTASSR